MAGSVNEAILLGNVGQAPDVKTSADGKKIVTFSLATSEKWTDKTTGEKKEATEWHRVVIFNQALAGICEKYVRKGSKLFIKGKIKTRKYTGQDGVERYVTEIVLGAYDGEIVLLDGRDAAPAPSEDGYGSTMTAADYQRAKNGADFNDEIPF